jgi:hypothetical protein
MTIRVTVVDSERDTIETTVVMPGDYLLIVAAPAHLATTEARVNGDHVLTVKGRLTRPGRPRTVQHGSYGTHHERST